MKRHWSTLLARFEALSLRERILVLSASTLTLLVLFLFLGILPILGALDRAQLRVQTAEDQMLLFASLAEQYQAVHTSLEQKKSVIENGPRGQALSKLEALAQRANLRVDSMAPESAGRNEKYVETKVLVNLKGVGLADVVNYLSQIESAQENFAIKTLRIQANRNQATLLDVTFTVSSFEPLGTPRTQ